MGVVALLFTRCVVTLTSPSFFDTIVGFLFFITKTYPLYSYERMFRQGERTSYRGKNAHVVLNVFTHIGNDLVVNNIKISTFVMEKNIYCI